ncbi:MarR family winged helix-turn-helix transcriptional regulator [Parvibacter caecicola]|uniref:MarR family winged helix-turn-helix transcriptional regulator n=1 Tax=Parvibacter caecicola TaxID=747645 RepID=UPI00249CD910|nr:MarR family winged helix-turn-helix transcriptional regulator [Parvibacter caecicola]
MDARKAHLVTLWCAVISKFEKGLARCLAPRLTVVQYRVLAHLAMPETCDATPARLAFAASMRPDDVKGALEALAASGLVQPRPGGVPLITAQGKDALIRASVAVQTWGRRCLEPLSPHEQDYLSQIIGDALVVPGSYFALRSGPRPADWGPIPKITTLCAVHQAMCQVVKKDCGLSLTDFRFLLELFPKKHRGQKQLRARDVTACLRVGRSYVTTASLRLEEAGLIQRIPDPSDARGILFCLTAAGADTVRSAGDDIFVLLSSLFGDRLEQRQFLMLTKHWLQAEDAALAGAEG